MLSIPSSGTSSLNQSVSLVWFLNALTLVPMDNLSAKSMELFGFTQPIVVHKQTMKVIDGEHRLRVASILNFEEIPVVFLDLDDTEMRYATLMHNRARGKDDNELIGKLYSDLIERGTNPVKELLMDRHES